MEFSGERYIPKPGDDHEELAIEHHIRYFAVQRLVAGKRVLDAACGEGYGSALLAERAQDVQGIDISNEAIAHARKHYKRKNLKFTLASIEKLPFPDASFDLVVSFETIEHVGEELQLNFLREVKRVLAPGGSFVISTPDKAVYSDEPNYKNEFHIREFYYDEFVAFLKQEFASVDIYGQQALLATTLQRPSDEELRLQRPTDGSTPSAKYLVAVCTNGSTDVPSLATASLDTSGTLHTMRRRIVALQDEVETRNVWALGLKKELEASQALLRSTLTRLNTEVAAVRETLGNRDHDLRIATAKLHEARLESEAHARLAEAHRQLTHAFNVASLELDKYRRSIPGHIYTFYRDVRDRALPVDSPQRELLKKGFKGIKRRVRSVLQHPKTSGHELAKSETPETFDAFSFVRAEAPAVSIIVPVYNHWATTYACLKSLHETLGDLPAEIILADDGSTDETRRAGEIVGGMSIIADGTNRGFLKNCNNAAREARGRYLFFLNNDTKVQANAVRALVDMLDAEPETGLVGSKLVYPDGRLQEAGGIVWRDGSAWNFGRLQDPGAPEFNYVRDVDYISGAAIMVRADLWREIGGFDEQYAPAYYEDTDLAFEVRKRGYAVRYQPRSVVVHYEGVSNGTDTSSGVKSYQVRNGNLFREKWRSVLERDHFPNGENVFVARDRSREKPRVLVVDHYVPHVDKDAGSRSTWSMLRTLLGMGCQVKFIGDNFFPHEPYTDMLQQAGIEVLHGEKYASGWAQWLADNGRFVDVVLLNRPHISPKYLSTVRTYTSARVLYYGHDLEHLRESKRAAIEDNEELRYHAEILRVRERQLMSRMDVVLSCSHSEASAIRDLCPTTQVEWVPLYTVDVNKNAVFRVNERHGILFVGGFAHKPNVDAVVNFVRTAWPAIHMALPGVTFTIAGSNPPPEVEALASESVRVLGFVPELELRELYARTRLVVVPLRYGAGVKGKTVEAMALGVPVVGTAIAFEGMENIESYLHPLQQAEPIERAIIELYGNEAALKQISARERDFAHNSFSFEAMAAAFNRAMRRDVAAKSA